MYRLLLGLIVGFLCVSPVFAADAGEVSVPLEGEQPRGAEAREQALRQGLETVIRRLTGRDRFHLARVLGVDLPTLEHWERGLGAPDGAAHALLLIALRFPEVIRAFSTD